MHQEEDRGRGEQDGVPPPSLITFSHPSRANRPREGYPLRFSATLRLLGRTSDSPPLLLALRANPLTMLFHPFIYHSSLFFKRKILIECRDISARTHTHTLTSSSSCGIFACLLLLYIIVPSISPASVITLILISGFTHKINPSNVESTLDAHDLRWHR